MVNTVKNFLITLNNLQQMRLKPLQKEQLKKQWKQLVTNKVTKVTKNSQQNNSATVANENDKEIPKERYISPDKRQEIINDLRLK